MDYTEKIIIIDENTIEVVHIFIIGVFTVPSQIHHFFVHCNVFYVSIYKTSNIIDFWLCYIWLVVVLDLLLKWQKSSLISFLMSSVSKQQQQRSLR